MSDFAVVIPHVEPTEAEGAVNAQTVIRQEWGGGISCRPTIVKTARTETDVVLVGEFTGDEELPVNLQDTVAFYRIGRRVHFDVLPGVVRVREDIAVLPRKGWVVGHGVGEEGEFCTHHGVCIFANNVTRDHFVRRDSLVQYFAFWYCNIQIDGLHDVGDLEGLNCQNSRGCRRKINLDVHDACA